MNTNLSRAANGFLLDLVLELKNGFIRRCDKMGLNSDDIAMLRDMTVEDIHYIINSEVSVLTFAINQDNLSRLVMQARLEQTRKLRIDRALALGGSIKLMEHFFGLMSNDVAARRRIAGIKIRAGRGSVLNDDQSKELWEIWAADESKTFHSETDEGLDLMLLAAEQMDISLTAVWNTVLRWENDNLTAATRRRA
ncbi:DUF2857 domain-containing protein [Pantoea sp. GM01]|uniref:DUF2857 domain-containing protein n=1 Tax=Pantoea sp. GM01 TaxID=1144320 RepID=UPI000270E14E|nr:DUF2857 domain-containing protein [Pantoea sp. GM01]EJL93102.1 Protein of unknown function (DUF2857) [Pantoea sp. GM01]